MDDSGAPVAVTRSGAARKLSGRANFIGRRCSRGSSKVLDQLINVLFGEELQLKSGLSEIFQFHLPSQYRRHRAALGVPQNLFPSTPF